MEYRQATKQEFESFIEGWEGNLVRDVCGIAEPPVATYNDFSDGKAWPDSVVAKVCLDYLGPNGEIDNSGKFFKYYLPKAQ